MRRLALLAALVAVPALAQDLPTATEAQFHDDVRLVTRVVAAAALAHDATGAYPTTPFALLGSRAGAATGLRAVPLSALTVESDGATVAVEVVPLPVAPYERADDVVRVIIARGADGQYTGRYEIRRRTAPDEGGAPLAYDRREGLVVTRAFGAACVDLATLRQQLAAGTYDAAPGSLSERPLEIRVHPAADTPTLFSGR